MPAAHAYCELWQWQLCASLELCSTYLWEILEVGIFLSLLKLHCQFKVFLNDSHHSYRISSTFTSNTERDPWKSFRFNSCLISILPRYCCEVLTFIAFWVPRSYLICTKELRTIEAIVVTLNCSFQMFCCSDADIFCNQELYQNSILRMSSFSFKKSSKLKKVLLPMEWGAGMTRHQFLWQYAAFNSLWLSPNQ